MRDDPFAPLMGLDQRLFTPTKEPPAPRAAAQPTHSDRTHEGSDVRSDSGGRAPTSARASTGTTARRDVRPSVRSSPETPGRTNGRHYARTPKATSTGERRPSAQTAREDPSERLATGVPHRRALERHAYDFYIDQVRWMNRMKVEIEERYDQHITGNAMVQLALELLMQDQRRRGRYSTLIRRLVFGERPNGGTDVRAGEGTSEGGGG